MVGGEDAKFEDIQIGTEGRGGIGKKIRRTQSRKGENGRLTTKGSKIMAQVRNWGRLQGHKAGHCRKELLLWMASVGVGVDVGFLSIDKRQVQDSKAKRSPEFTDKVRVAIGVGGEAGDIFTFPGCNLSEREPGTCHRVLCK